MVEQEGVENENSSPSILEIGCVIVSIEMPVANCSLMCSFASATGLDSTVPENLYGCSDVVLLITIPPL